MKYPRWSAIALIASFILAASCATSSKPSTAAPPDDGSLIEEGARLFSEGRLTEAREPWSAIADADARSLYLEYLRAYSAFAQSVADAEKTLSLLGPEAAAAAVKQCPPLPSAAACRRGRPPIPSSPRSGSTASGKARRRPSSRAPPKLSAPPTRTSRRPLGRRASMRRLARTRPLAASRRPGRLYRDAGGLRPAGGKGRARGRRQGPRRQGTPRAAHQGVAALVPRPDGRGIREVALGAREDERQGPPRLQRENC